MRAWPIYLITIGVIGATMYFVRHRASSGIAETILPPSVTLEQNIEIQFQDVVMQGRQKGVQRWVITSPKVSLSRDGRYTYFEPKPAGSFLNLKDWNAKEGEPDRNARTRSLVWKADKAQFDSFTEDLEITGKAVITTDTKDVIKTERVEYKSRQKQVFMPKHVDITMKDGTTISADELRANSEAEVMELKGRVDLLTNVNDEEKL